MLLGSLLLHTDAVLIMAVVGSFRSGTPDPDGVDTPKSLIEAFAKEQRRIWMTATNAYQQSKRIYLCQGSQILKEGLNNLAATELQAKNGQGLFDGLNKSLSNWEITGSWVPNAQLFILAVVVVTLHKHSNRLIIIYLFSAYGPAIHISSGLLQLAPDSEQPQLLLVPNVYSSSLGNPWPHFYVDTLTASHLPHSSIPSIPTIPLTPSINEPRIVVNDNVDFSQIKLPQHKVVHSHGR
nr:uncharacterized protein LOC118878375 [Drosophila suzukii]XP_036677020.1 uncharacterized protein LOC118878377 [Drosophila suzukii]XP_036677021.1 uncharacterized protein LOC118878378 [Drosophila suzukii]